MDLLGILEIAGRAQELVKLVRAEPLPDWSTNEAAFERHFGVPHEAYAEVAARLDPLQAALLHRTLAVNPEAAVLWVLSMEEVE